MWYLIGSILLSAVGVFMSSTSYVLDDYSQAYIMGTIASVAFLIGFLLLEYALVLFDFGIVFSAWAAGMAAVLALAGYYFWGDPASASTHVFALVTMAGAGGLVISGSRRLFS